MLKLYAGFWKQDGVYTTEISNYQHWYNTALARWPVGHWSLLKLYGPIYLASLRPSWCGEPVVSIGHRKNICVLQLCMLQGIKIFVRIKILDLCLDENVSVVSRCAGSFPCHMHSDLESSRWEAFRPHCIIQFPMVSVLLNWLSFTCSLDLQIK